MAAGCNAPAQRGAGPAGLLVIVPARNEAGNIAAVLAELRAAGPPCDVLVVDDGSSDGTAALAAAAGAIVVRLPFNLGIGGAVQTGFLYARRHGYQRALQFDGDGQHCAGEVPRLLDALAQGQVNVVIGSRYCGSDRSYRTTAARRLGMLVFQLVNTLLIGQRITDNTSGFRAYDRRSIEFLADHYPDDYPEPEAVVLLGRNGFSLREVPARMRPRHAGRSSITRVGAIYYMVKVLLTVLMNGIRPRIPSTKPK
ncbi:MAG TPA: glycosyltransferase family 2 protein [Candidatus Edwardsbacteria bacterium]|nr:glycosyltransferase family 2 protein [Candidatus Edwardsbacteria bacterium]